MNHLSLPFEPIGLLCNSQRNPLALATVSPVLSWEILASGFSRKQSAYRILAASSPACLETGLGDLWDSSKVISSETLNIEYEGISLTSRQECFWKVQLWDENNRVSEWSEIAFWKTGLLNETDWKSDWIASSEMFTANAPWFRKTFSLKGQTDKAYLYVNVTGYFEVYLNGEKVGNDVLSPAICDISKKTFYSTFEVSHYLKEGNNSLALWMGRGWYFKKFPGVQHENPVARIQLEIENESSDTNSACFEETVVSSNSSWKTKKSPYTLLGEWNWNGYGGEQFDTRRDDATWSLPDTGETDWQSAISVSPLLVPAVPVESPPNQITQTLHAASILDLGNGLMEVDFGKNLTGWLQMEFPQMERDQICKIWYADKKYLSANSEDGIFQFGTLKQSGSDQLFQTTKGTFRYQTYHQCDEWISAGNPGEEFCSKFNYHGFRYVILENILQKPVITKIKAHLIETVLSNAGHFSCSNPLLNQIHETNLWTLRCLNLGSYMVDCPHRERFGYGGDGHVSMEAMIMNFNAQLFYRKWFYDWVDAQNEKGMIPGTAPDHHGNMDLGPCWAGLSAVIAWKLYLNYNDKTILQAGCSLLEKYLTFLDAYVVDEIFQLYGGEWGCLGDWVEPDKGLDTELHKAARGTDIADELFNNCYHIYLWNLLEKFYEALGRGDKKSETTKKLFKMRTAVHKKYFNREKATYAGESEISQAFPLLTGIVPENNREAVVAHLRKLILEKRNGHLDTGMTGTYFLIQLLQESDNDLVYSIMNRTTFPSWGYLLQNGSTTFGEQWNGYWSQIHACLLSPGGWFYEGVAGILPIEPGFKTIKIKPALLKDLTYARASHHSPLGLIVCDWEKTERKTILRVTIPTNTKAEIHLQTEKSDTIWVNGESISTFPHGEVCGDTEGSMIFVTGSGNFVFEILK